MVLDSSLFWEIDVIFFKFALVDHNRNDVMLIPIFFRIKTHGALNRINHRYQIESVKLLYFQINFLCITYFVIKNHK